MLFAVSRNYLKMQDAWVAVNLYSALKYLILPTITKSSM